MAGPASEHWTVRRILGWTRDAFSKQGLDEPRLESELLLAHALGLKRLDLYLQQERPLTPDERAAFRELVKRRSRGEPTAYILGQREFMSLGFAVTPAVLIPRPETELCVELVLERLGPGRRVVDIGTGSGCIAVSVARYAKKTIEVVATDLSADALQVAKDNATRHLPEGSIHFFQGDLLEPLQGEDPFDIIVSNPPYIRHDVLSTLAPEVRDHEPPAALDGGADGLAVMRRLIEGAPRHLTPAGGLILEIGWDQGQAVTSLIEQSAFLHVEEVRRDLAGIPRVVMAGLKG